MRLGAAYEIGGVKSSLDFTSHSPCIIPDYGFEKVRSDHPTKAIRCSSVRLVSYEYSGVVKKGGNTLGGETRIKTLINLKVGKKIVMLQDTKRRKQLR